MKELSKNRKYYGLLTTVLFCSITFQIQAQNKFSDNLKLQVNYHFGVALPEYEFLTYIIDDYVQSVDISLIKETIGKNYWQQIFKYPEYGVSLYYSTLGNNEILGKEIALTGFFRVNFISRSRFRFYNRTGAGFSYVSRKFDFDDNFLNVAVGSHFNMHFNFRLGVNFSLSEKIELNTGLSFDHFSNANISEPNLGLNNLSAYGGLSYRLGQKIEKKKQSTALTITLEKVSHKLTIPFTDDASIENCLHLITFLLHNAFDIQKLQDALNELSPVAMRLEQLKGINNSTLINDSYNSDFNSLRIALEYLALQKQHRKHALILSDILQAGKTDEELNSDVLKLIHSYKVDKLIAVGEQLSKFSKLPEDALVFESTKDLIDNLPGIDLSDYAILIKGAREFGFEKIVSKLSEKKHTTLLEINLNNLL